MQNRNFCPSTSARLPCYPKHNRVLHRTAIRKKEKKNLCLRELCDGVILFANMWCSGPVFMRLVPISARENGEKKKNYKPLGDTCHFFCKLLLFVCYYYCYFFVFYWISRLLFERFCKKIKIINVGGFCRRTQLHAWGYGYSAHSPDMLFIRKKKKKTAPTIIRKKKT